MYVCVLFLHWTVIDLRTSVLDHLCSVLYRETSDMTLYVPAPCAAVADPQRGSDVTYIHEVDVQITSRSLFGSPDIISR